MKEEELQLLLTVARILREKIYNEVYAEQVAHFEGLCGALKPFEYIEAQLTDVQRSIRDGTFDVKSESRRR